MIDIARGFVNSWFESRSGLTTTGATVIEHRMSPNCIPEQLQIALMHNLKGF